MLFIPDDSFYPLRKAFFESLGLQVQPYAVDLPQGLLLLKNTPQEFLYSWIKKESETIISAENPYLIIHTGIFCGRRYLGNPHTPDEAKKILHLLSGRRHRLYTCMALKKPGLPLSKEKMVLTHVKTKTFCDKEYQDLKDAFPLYPLHSFFQSKIISVIGSPGNLQGTPAFELHNLLHAQGLL